MGKMNFLEKLDAITSKNKSLVCVGLDSDLSKIPKHLHGEKNPVLAFNKAIIEATSTIVQSYKLNLAFYEALGSIGFETMRDTLRTIPDDIVTIGDAKRGDIGNTAEMYARAIFDEAGFDAVTVAPYMGFDSVLPFVRFEAKGVFILALTSNKGARDFQYLEAAGTPLYKHVVEKVISWNQRKNCGLVVGATHPEELLEIRSMTEEIPILIPGLGAQGGDMEKSVKYGTTTGGTRALFNSSRAILYASSGSDFAEKAYEETERMRCEINSFRG